MIYQFVAKFPAFIHIFTIYFDDIDPLQVPSLWQTKVHMFNKTQVTNVAKIGEHVYCLHVNDFFKDALCNKHISLQSWSEAESDSVNEEFPWNFEFLKSWKILLRKKNLHNTHDITICIHIRWWYSVIL